MNSRSSACEKDIMPHPNPSGGIKTPRSTSSPYDSLPFTKKHGPTHAHAHPCARIRPVRVLLCCHVKRPAQPATETEATTTMRGWTTAHPTQARIVNQPRTTCHENRVSCCYRFVSVSGVLTAGGGCLSPFTPRQLATAGWHPADLGGGPKPTSL